MSKNISGSLNRIVVEVEGRTIRTAYSERNTPNSIALIDLDTEFGEGTAEVYALGDGTQFNGYFEAPLVLPDKVAEVFGALGWPTSSDKTRELRYLNNDGDSCPVCDSTDLRMQPPMGIENDTCVCDVECLECQSCWTNVYKLDCYEDLSSDYMSVSDHGFVVNINFTPEQASKYQSITIHGVKERLYHDAHGLCEVDEEEPTFFSVYLLDHEGLSHCFGDCGKLKLPVLRQLAESLANEHGWYYIDCTTQNHP